MKTSYDKFKNGDNLSDEELEKLINDLKTVADITSKFGKKWYLVYSNAYMDYSQLRSYQFNRKLP